MKAAAVVNRRRFFVGRRGERFIGGLYQKAWTMTHRPGLLVSRAGLVGRPRAKRDSIPRVILNDPWY
jgi:hypothetical protein